MKAIYLLYSLPIFVIAGLVVYFPTARRWVADFFTTRKLGVAGFALLMVGLYLAFFVAPEPVVGEGKKIFSQKIFYYHVPVAETSLIGFILGAVFGGLFLVKRERRYDFLSYASVEVGFLFGLLVEWTGVIWTRSEWGTWWEWEPRLTTYLILMLMYAGYFVLRSAMAEESSRARFAAVYSIIAAVSVPLTFFSIRLIPSVHPIVFTSSGAQMEPPMLAAFLISMFGMAIFSLALIRAHYSIQLMGEEVEYLKDRLGG
ncbi:MAG: cytochrome c biogenesis protein CcsA [Actinobacteria bacterium]|nr:cytochrome c biogenesis protein CcsA [Actinomycetota bacterium]